MAYKMIAERENETVRIERKSSLIIVAKARIWASEGWQVVVTDADGKSYTPPEFDQLVAAGLAAHWGLLPHPGRAASRPAAASAGRQVEARPVAQSVAEPTARPRGDDVLV